ncbi:DUF6519 domain-containing protein [Streptomyces sp. NPDC047042]|uniref:DUF6519 domain-containing protein n=1 Tax=Streptomyces sp. NPDC047042 TaxID=3154807 RepID=UPI00340B7444
MAIITPSTFDPLRRYANVRLQQGVPLVDADLNELDDVRKFELRAHLRWYVGDGVPEGSDGFRIVGGLDNDFTISAGVPTAPANTAPTDQGLRHVGRILVDGLDAIIPTDLRYSQQPLHAGRPGAAALAARLGVPVTPALTTPSGPTQFLVYLDMWERLLTPEEEPGLIHPGMGVESCARIVREWVVRVKTGSVLPAPGATDHIPAHLYYPLARLNRRGGQAAVTGAEISDRRERRLLTPPAHLLTDVLDVADPAAYRRGEGRPLVSLRSAINSLIKGELPASPDLAVSPAPEPDFIRRAAVADTAGGLVVVWQSQRAGGTTLQVVASRLDRSQPSAGFTQAAILTTGTAVHQEPTAVALPDGELLVAYQTGSSIGTGADVHMKRGPFSRLDTAPQEDVGTTTSSADTLPHAVVAGDFAVLFTHQSAAGRWFYRRFDHVAKTFVDLQPVQLQDIAASQQPLHASVADGMVWAAYTDGTNLRVLRLNPAASPGQGVDMTGSTPAPASSNAFVLAHNATNARVFFDSGSTLMEYVCTNGVWSSPVAVAGAGGEKQPSATVDAENTLYLLSQRPATGGGNEIVLRRRRNLVTEVGGPLRLTLDNVDNAKPFPVFVPGQGIWMFWQTNRLGNNDIFAKCIVPTV